MSITAGRIAKPIDNCVGHRTAAEKELRSSTEAELMSGLEMRESEEVKSNEIAHGLFKKLKRNLKAIGKFDALFENVVNRYCIIYAETYRLAELYDRILDDLEELNRQWDAKTIAYEKYIESKAELYGHLGSVEKRVNKKRDMLFAIEKENLMTMQGVLRSVPKKPLASEEDPLEGILGRRRERGGTVCQFPTQR